MQAREARRLDLRAEGIERRLRLLHSAQALDQRAQLVDGEDRLALNLVVGGMVHVARDDAVHHGVERRAVHCAGPDDLVRQAGLLDIPQRAGIVIRPHEEEFDLVVVAGLEEAIVDALLQEWLVVVPVPVEDQHVDPVAGGGGDFLFHDARVGLVLVAPERDIGLLVPREAGLAVPDNFPFANITLEEGIPAFLGMVRWPVIGGDVIARRRRCLRLRGARRDAEANRQHADSS